MWTYQARLLRVVDGDTVDLILDLGFDIHLNQRVRLAGLNAPEMNTPGGRIAKEWVANWFQAFNVGPWPYTATTQPGPARDKYGRWIADIRAADSHLNAALLAAGQALPWPAL